MRAAERGALHLAIGKEPSSYFRAVDAGTANYREIYWRMYVKNQAGWTGGGGEKLTRAIVFGQTAAGRKRRFAHVWRRNQLADRMAIT